MAFFKYQTTKAINVLRGTPGVRVWQRNYYEHVIRSEESLEMLRQYIAENPQRWDQDQLHPDVPSRW
jgi:REP element-mobilizing transposase RayT